MNGRHVLAPQGARAIQNPAYRPAGNSFHDIAVKSADISRLRLRARLLIQPPQKLNQLGTEVAAFVEIGAIKSYLARIDSIRRAVMGHVDKRSITLSPELAAAVDDVVAAGEYASASEVIRDALRQWKDRRDLHGYTLEELRKLVQEGIDSGPALDGQPIMERLRAKYLRMAEAKGFHE